MASLGRGGGERANAADADGHGQGFTGDLSWLLDDLVTRVTEISKAVVLTRDGLVVGSSRGLTREDAEHLSAMAAGMQSLARGAGRHFGGGRVRQTIVEMENSFLFVTAAGEGSCLAALTTATADVGLVAFEMAVLVKRVGSHLLVDPRPGLAGGVDD